MTDETNRPRFGEKGKRATDESADGPTGQAPALGRRGFVKTVSAAAVGAAGIGTGTLGSGLAAPDSLPTAEHMHRGHQDVIFLGIHFQDTTPPAPVAEYEAALFDADSSLGYDDYTLQGYFDVVSDGRFSMGPGPAGLVGWYQASQQSGDYDLGEAVRETLDAAIADGFDITAYDGENPTQLVAMAYEGGRGGGVAWVGRRIEREGVEIRGFCKAPIRRSPEVQDVNYAAHEYLHLHGTTDFYQDPGTGGMGVMGRGPLVNMIPWSKVNVDLAQTPEPTGWDETTAIHPTDQAGILPPQSVANQFYTVVGEPNSSRDDPDFHKHYYLAYADGTGVDSPLDQSQQGLVVWHHHQSMGVDWGASNLQFATPSADGSRFRATDSGLDSGLVGTDIVLDGVSTDYGTLQFNDPPHRSVSAGSTSAYAVDVDASRPDWLPDLAHREDQRHGDVVYTDDVLDARVSWANGGDDVTLRLIDPSGAEHAVSDDLEPNFAVVRSDPVTGRSALDGGWKLVEETTASGTVDYYRATTAPTYELATTAAIESASLADGVLSATVSLAFGDGSSYSYDSFGSPGAGQFEVTVDGTVVDSGSASVSEQDEATYDLTAQVGAVGDGDHSVSIAFVDRKAGVTHRTDAAETTVAGSGGGTGSDGGSDGGSGTGSDGGSGTGSDGGAGSGSDGDSGSGGETGSGTGDGGSSDTGSGGDADAGTAGDTGRESGTSSGNGWWESDGSDGGQTGSDWWGSGGNTDGGTGWW